MAAPGYRLASGLQIWTAPPSLAVTSLHTDEAHGCGSLEGADRVQHSVPTLGPWQPRAQATPSWASGPVCSRSAPKGALRTDIVAARPAGGVGKSPPTPLFHFGVFRSNCIPAGTRPQRLPGRPALSPALEAHLLEVCGHHTHHHHCCLSCARLLPSPRTTGLTLRLVHLEGHPGGQVQDFSTGTLDKDLEVSQSSPQPERDPKSEEQPCGVCPHLLHCHHASVSSCLN